MGIALQRTRLSPPLPYPKRFLRLLLPSLRNERVTGRGGFTSHFALLQLDVIYLWEPDSGYFPISNPRCFIAMWVLWFGLGCLLMGLRNERVTAILLKGVKL